MSMLLMVKAMKAKVGSSGRKLVLLKLADNANDQGECWPSYQYIADQCEMSRRTAVSHIDALCNQGLVRKELRPGIKGNSSNIYIITLGGEKSAPPPSAKSALGGEKSAPPPSAKSAPGISHSFESVNEPKPSSSEVKKTTSDNDSVRVIPEAAVQTPRGEKWGSADDLKAAQWIYQKALINNPTLKEPSWPAWANTIRLMRQRDHRSHREICGLFDWASKDSFWCANVLCPATLRKQWDKLSSKMLTATKRPDNSGMIDPNDTSWILDDWGY